MGDVSKLKIGDELVNIKDTLARESILETNQNVLDNTNNIIINEQKIDEINAHITDIIRITPDDNTDVIQEKINRFVEGYTIYFSKGEYVIDKPLYIHGGDMGYKEIKIVGEGFSTIIKPSDSFIGDELMYIRSWNTNYRSTVVNNIRFDVANKDIDGLVLEKTGMGAVISNLFFEGEPTSENRCAIRLKDNATVCTLRDIVIKGFNNCVGIGCDGRFDSSILERVDTNQCKYGIYIKIGSNVNIVDCRLDEGYIGVKLGGYKPTDFFGNGAVGGCNIRGTRLENNSFCGIYLSGFDTGLSMTKGINIDGCYFTGLKRGGSDSVGVYVERVETLNIVGNFFRTESTEAIALRVPVKYVKSINTYGNHCFGDCHYISNFVLSGLSENDIRKNMEGRKTFYE